MAESERPGRYLNLSEIGSIIRSMQHPLPDDVTVVSFLEELSNRDWVETDGNGADLSTHGFRITAKGQNRASASVDYADVLSKAVNALPAAENVERQGIPSFGFGSGAFGAGTFAGPTNSPPLDMQNDGSPIPQLSGLPAIDSKRWTGTQFVLIDGELLQNVRSQVKELHRIVHLIHIESNSESQNIKGLVDALLAVSTMAEPEITILDRILASPKFKDYAVLFTIVATLRGAIGI